MYKTMELLYMAVVLFQGYCLQYFLGSFLESRWKGRWNSLCMAVLYAAGLYGLSRVFHQDSRPFHKFLSTSKSLLSFNKQSNILVL